MRPEGWINADKVLLSGIDICTDIRDGLPIRDNTIDYITSQHVLQQLKIEEIMAALQELHRVLKPDGVLRLCLPDFDKAVDAYRSDNADRQWCWDWNDRSGNLISQIIDCNSTRTPLSSGWTVELMTYAGFRDVREVAYGTTSSRFAEITSLDSRPDESFLLEGYK